MGALDIPEIKSLEQWLDYTDSRPIPPTIQLSLIARLITDRDIRDRLIAAQVEWVLWRILAGDIRSHTELEEQTLTCLDLATPERLPAGDAQGT